ncbi:MAG: trigger factor [Janthinobacterium lividum]
MTPVEAVEQPEQTQDNSDSSGLIRPQSPALNPELTREVAVEVPADEVSKAFSKIVRRYQKMARIPGFRAGKVPESLIRGRFAKEVRQEVMDSLVQDRFRSEMESANLQPISQPQIIELNLQDEQPLRFRAQFEVAPVVDVTGYETVTVERPSVQLEDAEYDAELDRVMDAHATIETVEDDRPLADGDWAEISFKGARRKTEGETIPEEAAETDEIEGEDVMVEIGGKNTLPAFNDALRGQSKGQEFDLEVVYPADFGDVRLAGLTIDYNVKVNAIKRKTYPEKNDDFAKQLGDFETWDAFSSTLRENATNGKKQNAENEAKGKLVDTLVEKFNFPVPESFVQQQIDVRLDRGLRALAQQGMTREQMQTLDFARLRDAQRDEAVKEVKASLILDKIAETTDVQVKDEDVERELMILSMQSREPLEQLRERLSGDGSINRIREQMRREATATALYEKMA